MLPSPPQTLGGHVRTFTWTHAHAHFASRRHAASVCEDGGSGDAARPADALTARAFAHDRYRYCTDRVQKTGGKYREALLHTSLVKKARGPGRGWRFGDPVPPAEGPMAQDSAHDQHISSADRVQELGSRVAPEVSTARLLGQRVRGTWEAWKASRGRDGAMRGDAMQGSNPFLKHRCQKTPLLLKTMLACLRQSSASSKLTAEAQTSSRSTPRTRDGPGS